MHIILVWKTIFFNDRWLLHCSFFCPFFFVKVVPKRTHLCEQLLFCFDVSWWFNVSFLLVRLLIPSEKSLYVFRFVWSCIWGTGEWISTCTHFSFFFLLFSLFMWHDFHLLPQNNLHKMLETFNKLGRNFKIFSRKSFGKKFFLMQNILN